MASVRLAKEVLGLLLPLIGRRREKVQILTD